MIREYLEPVINLNASLQNIYYLVILVALIFTIAQVQSCIKSNNINLFDKVYNENKAIRENQIDARTQLRLIMLELADSSNKFKTELDKFVVKDETVVLNYNDPDFQKIEKKESIWGFIGFILHIPNLIYNKCRLYFKILKYRLENFPSYLDKGLYPMTTRGKIVCGNIFTDIYFNKKYKDLREAGYHYEYLGILIKYKMIPFKLVFDLITWPDDFWNESYYLRSIVRDHWLPDFWENAEYLHDLYMDARLKGSIINGEYDKKKLIYSKKRCNDHSKLSADKPENQEEYEKEVINCEVCNAHSNLSAYEHMSQIAYNDAKSCQCTAKKVEIIGDDNYNSFKNAWKDLCHARFREYEASREKEIS